MVDNPILNIEEVYVNRAIAWFKDIQNGYLDGYWTLEDGFIREEPNKEALASVENINWEQYF
ncbi:MAG: hypothetical protein Tsb0014_22110 [Pleurocapsa sp.]